MVRHSLRWHAIWLLWMAAGFLVAELNAAPPAPAPMALRKGVQFLHACHPGPRQRILAVGDILLHDTLQKQAVRVGSFAPLWQQLTGLIQSADISFANLEGPAAAGVNSTGGHVQDPGLIFDQQVYNSFPLFNYPAQLVADLAISGFDILSLGNNHILDRKALGIDRTIAALEQAGIAYSGARRSNHEVQRQPWVAILTRNGLTTAWIGCSYGTNGVIDFRRQVLLCHAHQQEIRQLVTLWKDQVDAVFITPHWGEENSTQPTPVQEEFAKEMLELGALAILGSHPHTVQPWVKHRTRDGRETLIVYSLGNFVNGQKQIWQQSIALLLLDLIQDQGKTRIAQVRFVPAFMANQEGERLLTALDPDGSHAGLKHLLKVLPKANMIGYDQALTRTSDNPDSCQPPPATRQISIDPLDNPP
ncbi:MAG: CapA family protein [Magnetococcales bacterium]|nr:CapA family protein [Magnetococcales bacterium]